MLCIIFTTWLAFKPRNKGLFHVIRVRGWKYFLLAIVDVEANYVLVKAFQYTALASIQVSGAQHIISLINEMSFAIMSYINIMTEDMLYVSPFLFPNLNFTQSLTGFEWFWAFNWLMSDYNIYIAQNLLNSFGFK